MSDTIFLHMPTGFSGRVSIHPNGADMVYVDGSSNSAGGRDDDERVHFITYRGKDYTMSTNWKRSEDGVWFPLNYTVSKRGSFGMDKAPKTYAAAIVSMIADGLTKWFTEANGGQALRSAEVRWAAHEVSAACNEVRDAQEDLAKAEGKLSEARERLAAALLAANSAD
jgi:hypothetical protein